MRPNTLSLTMCSELLTNEYLTCEKKNQNVLVRIVKNDFTSILIGYEVWEKLSYVVLNYVRDSFMKEIMEPEMINSLSTDLYCEIAGLPVRAKSSCKWCIYTGQAKRWINCYILSKGRDVQFQQAMRAIYTFTTEPVIACFARKEKVL